MTTRSEEKCPQSSLHSATEKTLRSTEFKHELAKRLRSSGLSALKLAADKSEVLSAADQALFGHDGRQLTIDDEIVDRAYGYDLSFSWINACKNFAFKKPVRRSDHSIIDRLELWDLYFKVIGDHIELD